MMNDFSMSIPTTTKPQMMAKYYAYETPEVIPENYRLYGEEYRGWMIAREGEHLLYTIRTLQNGMPPDPLRSRFTKASLAKSFLDDWLADEEKKQKASETKKAKNVNPDIS